MNLLQARGKLLISAEYMVLHGSMALALPLKMGQALQRIRSVEPALFSWNAWQENELWFRAEFNPSTLDVLKTTDHQRAGYLRRLLEATIELKPRFQKELSLLDVETRLDFSPSWGFGSSSSLTALVARWAGVNPMDLHFRISEGSGYDVACAMADSPIIYSLGEEGPRYQPLDFKPPFADRIYFVWLGSKQHTASHVAKMAGRFTPDERSIEHFSTLTMHMLEAGELSVFRALMEEHEARLSALLRQETVAETRFPGLQGSVKSLGAWGGDFVMIASEQERADLYNYLDKLGFTTRFPYNELVYGT